MSTSIADLFDKVASKAPVAAMARALLEYSFEPHFLDEMFRQHAQRQRQRDLLFSTAIQLLTLAATRTKDSLHAAYLQEDVNVSFTAVCDKINGTELCVAAALVREPAQRLSELSDKLGIAKRVVAGFQTTILDGNHLASTEHRPKPLRNTRRGPLPGQAIVFFDADRRLFSDVVLCEDGHAQERQLFGEALRLIQPKRLYIADRNFCTKALLAGIVARRAFFLIRKHGSLGMELLGARKSPGNCRTGKVFEQAVQIGSADEAQAMRCITIQLDKPTQKGEKEVHLLTNIPTSRGGAVALADTYMERWRIENAFNELERTLRSEIDTLAYPPAALLAFSISLTLYNIISIVQQAIEREHGDAGSREKISTYYFVSELKGTYQGMMLLLEPKHWTSRFGSLTAEEMTEALRAFAKHVQLRRYKKHPRGPKKKGPRKQGGATNHHVSTAKLLAAAKATE